MSIAYDMLTCFLTLKCNFKCSYCINCWHGKRPGPIPESPAIKWIDALSKTDIHVINIVGGEPSLHPQFVEIVNGIKTDSIIIVSGNGSERSFDSLEQLIPRHNIRIQISLHPEMIHRDQFDLRITRLIDQFTINNVGVHQVVFDNEPVCKLNSISVSRLDRMAMTPGFKIVPSRLQEMSCSIPVIAECYASNYVLVAPDGEMWFCHTALYNGLKDFVIGNFFENGLPAAVSMTCPHYGHCNPCDSGHKVKLS